MKHSMEGGTPIMEEDYEQRLVTELREHKLFKTTNKETQDAGQSLPLKDIPSETFRKICLFSEESPVGKTNQKIDNVKTKRNGFRTYLQHRYHPRLSVKISALFDWQTTPMKYEQFFKTIESTILRPSETYDDCLQTLKLLTFTLYDMNNDG